MYHDINAQAHRSEQAQPPGSTSMEQVAELIERYPNLSEVELARLINLYSQLSALDVALMISDEQLGRKLDMFFADHRAKLKTPFRQYAILVAIAVVGVVTILWTMAVVS